MFALPIYAKTAGRWLSRGLTLVVFAVASGSLWPLARAPDTSTAPRRAGARMAAPAVAVPMRASPSAFSAGLATRTTDGPGPAPRLASPRERAEARQATLSSARLPP